MNFEVIDNCFQILFLWCAALIATGLSIRYRERRFLILALAYACFSMGTLYWVLYLAILGMFPQVFYVAEISWLAAYLFYLSLQVLRSEHLSIHFAPLPALLGCLVAVAAVINNIFGPSPLMLALFAVTAGAIAYLSLFRLQHRLPFRQTDAVLFLCVVLQVALYAVSSFFSDYTHFNLYFAVDITLTCAFVALLPLTFREVKPS